MEEITQWTDPKSGRHFIVIEGEVYYVDEILAKIFLPNIDPDRCKRVMHIDGDMGNDDIENLRWVE